MKLNQMFPGNYLKKEDVAQPVRAIIARVELEEISGDGGKETKPVLHFQGDMKPMILNRGNADAIADGFGDDSVNWIGKTIEVYSDPSVMYAGKRVGGIRIRVPAQHQSPAVSLTTVGLWDYSDGVAVTARQTTAQVIAFLESIAAHGMDPEKIRVRPSGSKEAPVPAPQWLAEHDQSAPVPIPVDEVPW